MGFIIIKYRRSAVYVNNQKTLHLIFNDLKLGLFGVIFLYFSFLFRWICSSELSSLLAWKRLSLKCLIMHWVACKTVLPYFVSHFTLQTVVVWFQAQLEQIWQNIQIEQSDSNVVDSLSEFYEQLLQVWQVQVHKEHAWHCIFFLYKGNLTFTALWKETTFCIHYLQKLNSFIWNFICFRRRDPGWKCCKIIYICLLRQCALSVIWWAVTAYVVLYCQDDTDSGFDECTKWNTELCLNLPSYIVTKSVVWAKGSNLLLL